MKKGDILFQLGFSEGLTLEKLLGVRKEDVLTSIPYWMVIPRLTKKQLASVAKEKNITVPENCTRTRDALCKIILSAYDKWDDTLSNASSLGDLLEGFPDLDNFNFEFIKTISEEA